MYIVGYPWQLNCSWKKLLLKVLPRLAPGRRRRRLEKSDQNGTNYNEQHPEAEGCRRLDKCELHSAAGGFKNSL